MKGKSILKKAIAVTAAAMACMLLMSGCGQKITNSKACLDIVGNALQDVTTTKVDTTVAYGDSDGVYDQNFEQLYGFSIDKVTDGAIAYASTGGYADEISIVKVKDSNDTSEVKKYMDARLQQRLHDFENYSPSEAKKVENGKTFVQGDYVCMVIADDADDIVTAMKADLSKR